MSVDELTEILVEVEKNLPGFTMPAGPGEGQEVPQAHAYWGVAPSNLDIPTPCFMNLWRPTSINRGGNGLRVGVYVMTVQYLQCKAVAGTNLEVNGRMAAIAFDRFIDELDKHIGPGRSNHQSALTGTGDDFPAGIERNKVTYLGWEVEITFTITKDVSYALGD